VTVRNIDKGGTWQLLRDLRKALRGHDEACQHARRERCRRVFLRNARRVSSAELKQVRGKLDITMPQALPPI
jgi:hypothetical protein